jgi:pimeloyl-ACP methyl ester carboxylesterase
MARPEESDREECLQVIPECGHLVPLEKPEEFHQAVSEFLR